MTILYELLRFLVGCYFVRSGSAKMEAPKPLYATIMAYKLTGAKEARFLASIIPPAEFFGGLTLASNISPLPSAAILLLLLCASSAAMVVVLVRKNPPENGGRGASPTAVSAGRVVRNALLALALLPTLMPPHPSQDNKDFAISCLVVALILVASFLRYRKLVEIKV